MKAMKLTRAFLIALASSVLLPVAVAANSDLNSIEAVDVVGHGGNVVVRLTMKQPLVKVPASFSVVTPPRIAFDFPNTHSGLTKNSQDENKGDRKSTRLNSSH